MAIARTTELQAVNTMLSAVGEPPINNLEGQKNADAAIAKNILDEVSSEVQTHGWHFNTQPKVELSPNSSRTCAALHHGACRSDLPRSHGWLSSTPRLLAAG